MAETPPTLDSGAPAPPELSFAQQVQRAQQGTANPPVVVAETPTPANVAQPPTPEPDAAPPAPQADAADSPAVDPAEQRVRDAQRRMHAATQAAAQARQEADGAKSEAEVLRAQNEELIRALSSLPSIPPFPSAQQPIQATQAPDQLPPYAPPAPIAPPGPVQPAQTPQANDLRAQILQAYKSAPDDESAVATLAEQTIQHAVAQARREFQAELAQREQAARHAQASQAHNASVQTNVTAHLEKVAPDVPADIFWRYVAAERQAPTLPAPPPEIKNESELIAWQTGQFVERIRKDLSGTRARQTTVHAEQAALRGPAAAVISAAPSNRAPATPGGGAPMSMVDQLKAEQRRFLGRQ